MVGVAIAGNNSVVGLGEVLLQQTQTQATVGAIDEDDD
jgi:hypothetical protein